MTRQAHIVDFEQARSVSSKGRPSAHPRSEKSGNSHSRRSPRTADAETHRTASAETRRPHRRSNSQTDTASQSPVARNDVQRTRRSMSDAQLSRAARTAAQARTRTNEQAGGSEKKKAPCRDAGTKGRLEKLQHDARKKKADRVFDKTMKADVHQGSDEPGSRAALYKGQMGSTHRKSARMQNENPSRKRAVAPSPGPATRLSLKVPVMLVILACMVASCAFLYPAAKNYYTAMRDEAKVQAEYDAVSAHNDRVQSEIDTLSTSEGIEDRAREQYGWVKSGENSVSVSGLDSSSGSNVDTLVARDGVSAPATWYSGVLDRLFGYGG